MIREVKRRAQEGGRWVSLRYEPGRRVLLVIGIDPGSIYTGYGILEKSGQELRHVTSGRISCGRGRPLPDRLEIIYEGLSGLLEEYQPQTAAMESIFTARNPRSALVLGHARGVAMLSLRLAELEISEYPPSTVKQAVTGSGRASKDQVQYMVRLLLQLNVELKEDASDALAVAICHAQSLDFQNRLMGR